MPQRKTIWDTTEPIPEWAGETEGEGTKAAKAGVGNVAGGMKDFIAQLSPVRFREGWLNPTLEVPQAAKSLLSLGQDIGNVTGFRNPENFLFGGGVPTSGGPDIQQAAEQAAQPTMTAARGAGAMFAPNQIQGPSDEEWAQAQRGAGQQFMASLPGLPGVGRDIQAAGRGIQNIATRAGIPQALMRGSAVAEEVSPMANVLPPWMRHPVQTLAGPLMRGGARALYGPDMAPQTPPGAPVESELVPPTPIPQPPSGPAPGTFVSGKGFTMAKKTSLNPPAVSEAKPTAGASPASLPAGPPPPKQLPEASPKMGGNYLGQEGGLGPQPHTDVVAQRPMIVRDLRSGQFRYETVNEMKGRLTNLGRGVTRQPSAEAQPYVPPKPPPAPKKAK